MVKTLVLPVLLNDKFVELPELPPKLNIFNGKAIVEELDQDVDVFGFQDETFHRLDTIDVYEEKDGITLSDAYDDGFLFIPDEDLVSLYEIIKERLIKKY